MLGHESIGTGAVAVMILNDWMCDTSTWDGARVYLDGDRCTWVFADLRGYGRSKGQSGTFTVEEAAADVIALADKLGWGTFAIVGHSMSSLVALHVAQHRPDRIARAVALTPPPPSGFGADDATIESMQALALGGDILRGQRLAAMWGNRLSPQWIAFKTARWRAAADPHAVAGYVRMFARDGLPDRSTKITMPVLAVTGERDAPVMRSASVTDLLLPMCSSLTVMPLADSGHYPMQEAPPLLVAIVERFVTGETKSSAR